MKHTTLFSTMLCAGALSALGTEAQAAPPEAAIRYNMSPVPTGLVLITSDSSINANTLKTVTVECPDTGYLLVTGTTAFQFSSNGKNGVNYGIVKNSDGFQDPFANSVRLNNTDPEIQWNNQIPASIQRADTCARTEVVTYRFKANKEFTLQATAYAVHPVLTVQFFNHLLGAPFIPLP